jgi:hypothetical protein
MDGEVGKSKSQNIWQQIIVFSSTVMQMICAWHKIWTQVFGEIIAHNSTIFVFHITLSCEFSEKYTISEPLSKMTVLLNRELHLNGKI